MGGEQRRSTTHEPTPAWQERHVAARRRRTSTWVRLWRRSALCTRSGPASVQKPELISASVPFSAERQGRKARVILFSPVWNALHNRQALWIPHKGRETLRLSREVRPHRPQVGACPAGCGAVPCPCGMPPTGLAGARPKRHSARSHVLAHTAPARPRASSYRCRPTDDHSRAPTACRTAGSGGGGVQVRQQAGPRVQPCHHSLGASHLLNVCAGTYSMRME
jgi:hypothetical protein